MKHSSDTHAAVMKGVFFKYGWETPNKLSSVFPLPSIHMDTYSLG